MISTTSSTSQKNIQSASLVTVSFVIQEATEDKTQRERHQLPITSRQLQNQANHKEANRKQATWQAGNLTSRQLDKQATWQGVTWQGVTWQGVTWQGVTWQRVAWQGVVWQGVATRQIIRGMFAVFSSPCTTLRNNANTKTKQRPSQNRGKRKQRKEKTKTKKQRQRQNKDKSVNKSISSARLCGPFVQTCDHITRIGRKLWCFTMHCCSITIGTIFM